MSALNCPACGHEAPHAVRRFSIADQHALLAPEDAELQRRLTAAALDASLEYELHRCPECGLEFVAPLRAPTPEWYRLLYSTRDLYPKKRWEFDQVLSHVGSDEPILEIGCGAGAFLDCCRRRGLSASGLDFSAGAVSQCRSRGLDASTLDLSFAPASNGATRFRHIVGFHVLEHLERPGALFDYAACCALPEARLWLSVPSDRNPGRFFDQRDPLDEPPHHMTRWTAAALEQLGVRHGWRLHEILYQPMPLRVAVWWISVCSHAYQSWKEAGRFRHRWAERGFRAAQSPLAALRRLTSLRFLSGHAMLAQFDPLPGPRPSGPTGNL